MNRHDNDLPEIVSIAPCTGWVARYRGDDACEYIEEPIAAWGVLVETIGGERTRSVVPLVPEGGWLTPASDATNFVEMFQRDDAATGHHITPAQCDEARRLIGTMQLWMDRVAVEQEDYPSKADIAVHRGNLTRLAVLLGLMPQAD